MSVPIVLEIRIGRHVTAFGTWAGEDSSRDAALTMSALWMEDARHASGDHLLRIDRSASRAFRFCRDELAAALSRRVGSRPSVRPVNLPF